MVPQAVEDLRRGTRCNLPSFLESGEMPRQQICREYEVCQEQYSRS